MQDNQRPLFLCVFPVWHGYDVFSYMLVWLVLYSYFMYKGRVHTLSVQLCSKLCMCVHFALS